MPKITGTGTYITLNNTANSIMFNVLNPSELSQDGEPTLSTPYEVHTISGDNTLKIQNKNLFDKTKATFGALNRATGEQGNDNLYKTSDYIIINPTKSYYTNVVLYASDGFGYAFYDKDKTYISGIPSRNLINSIPTNAKYIRICYRVNTTTANTDENTLYFVEGVAATDYVEHQEQTAQVNLGGSDLIKTSKTESGYINSSNEIVSSTTWVHTDYIDISNTNCTYTYKSYGSGSNPKTIIYNADKSVKEVVNVSSNLTKILNGAYVRISYANDTTKPQLIEDYVNGNLEYCKIGNYEDRIFKNVSGDVDYSSEREDGAWYIKKNIGKVVLDGSENWNKVTLTTGERYFFVNDNMLQQNSTGDDIFSNYFKGINYATYYSIGGIDGISYQYYNNSTRLNLFFNTAFTDINAFKSWLSTNTPSAYYPLATPTYTLLNDTLQSQLEYIYNQMLAYKGQTNISQINNDLPFVIDSTALKDLTSL